MRQGGDVEISRLAKTFRTLYGDVASRNPTLEQIPQILSGRVAGDQFCPLVRHPQAFIIIRESAERTLDLLSSGLCSGAMDGASETCRDVCTDVCCQDLRHPPIVQHSARKHTNRRA